MEVINIKSLKRMDHVSSNTRTKNKRKVQVAHTCVMRSETRRDAIKIKKKETRRDEMELSRKPAKQKSKGKFKGAEKKRKQKKETHTHTHRERERARERERERERAEIHGVKTPKQRRKAILHLIIVDTHPTRGAWW